MVRPVNVTVNYRERPDRPYDNAYAFRDRGTGTYVIVAGQGRDADLGHDALILVHEFGHPMFDQFTTILVGLGILDEQPSGKGHGCHENQGKKSFHGIGRLGQSSFPVEPESPRMTPWRSR